MGSDLRFSECLFPDQMSDKARLWVMENESGFQGYGLLVKMDDGKWWCDPTTPLRLHVREMLAHIISYATEDLYLRSLEDDKDLISAAVSLGFLISGKDGNCYTLVRRTA